MLCLLGPESDGEAELEDVKSWWEILGSILGPTLFHHPPGPGRRSLS